MGGKCRFEGRQVGQVQAQAGGHRMPAEFL
jgi:hypothetical protein